eukprot:4396177-Amphidinium_carterae.1
MKEAHTSLVVVSNISCSSARQHGNQLAIEDTDCSNCSTHICNSLPGFYMPKPSTNTTEA